jgi:hypothetical protein
VLAIASAAAILAACMDQKAMIAKLTPPEIDRFDRDCMAMVARGQIDSIVPLLIPYVDPADARRALPEVVNTMKTGRLDSARIVGVNVSTTKLGSGKSTRRTDLTYQLPTDSAWLVVNIITVDSGDVRRLYRFHIDLNKEPLEERRAFSLEGHSVGDLLVLALALANVLLSFLAFGTLLLARGMPKKKRWMFASLIGVGELALNWTTGATQFLPLTLQLFGAGFTANGIGAPWIIKASIPVGPLAALWRHRRWRNPPPTAPDDTSMPAPAPGAPPSPESPPATA